MDGPELQRLALERARELPGSELDHPFGTDWDVFKVRGKVFMLHTDWRGDAVVTLKADPEEARALVESYAEVSPGYHMNKRHWITLSPGTALDPELLAELVTESYRLVVAGLPRARRPVDPATFARAPWDQGFAGPG